VKQRDFPGFVVTEAIKISEGYFDLVVQQLDDPAENSLLGPEVIEHLPMFREAGGNGYEA